VKNLTTTIILSLSIISSSKAMSEDFKLVGCIVAGVNSSVVLKSGRNTNAFKIHAKVTSKITIKSVTMVGRECQVVLSNGLVVPKVETSFFDKVEELSPEQKEEQKVEELKDNDIDVDNLSKKDAKTLQEDVKAQIELDKAAKERTIKGNENETSETGG